MATPESYVKLQLKNALKKIDGLWQYWPVSNGMGAHGVPDCLGCYRGLMFGVEVKAPGRRNQKDRGVSGLQMLQKEKIELAGGMWAVVDCQEEIEKFIEALMRRANTRR